MHTHGRATPQDVHTTLIIIIIIAIATMIYNIGISRGDIKDLREKHYDLQDRVSRIEIKGDDTANQLMLSIENQYWQEIQTAVDIAYNAGYQHRKVVLINPSMNIVRLSDIDHSEISVNIVSKVITTYSPN